MASSSAVTVRGMLQQAALYGLDRRDAELLLAHSLGRDRVWLLTHPEHDLPVAVREPFLALAHRRAAGEPLQYLLGTREFFGLPLAVTPAVLIPRPETELLVEAVLGWLHEMQERIGAPRVVDVGTGSGAIALAIASRVPHAEITALDLSPAALEVARGNAARLGLAERVRFLESDLLAAVHTERFDVVVSNPPYVPDGDRATMQPEVRDYEPAGALFAGADGLDVYRRLIPQAWDRCSSGGLLAMEFGFGQRETLRELLTLPEPPRQPWPGSESAPRKSHRPWQTIDFRDDLAGIPRVLLARRP